MRAWLESDPIGLLQCVLSGRIQEAISSLTAGHSSVYRKVKVAVLKAYELVPKAYRQRIETRERVINKIFTLGAV